MVKRFRIFTSVYQYHSWLRGIDRRLVQVYSVVKWDNLRIEVSYWEV